MRLWQRSVRLPRFYGWWIVAGVGVAQNVVWGVLYYSFSVLLVPMEADLGWPRPTLAAGFSLALLVAGLTAFPIGRWIDRRGARGVMAAGSVAATALLVAWSYVGTETQYFAVLAGIGAAMAMLLYEPAFALIAVWFRARRRQALTAVTLAGGLASTVFLPLTAWLVELYGWRGALRLLALVLFAITVPVHVLIVRRSPQDLGLCPDGLPAADGVIDAPPPVHLGGIASMFRSRAFRGLAIASTLHAATLAAFSVHLVTLLVERGAAPRLAAAAAGFVGLMQLPGRAALPLVDREATRPLLAPTVFAQAAALALLAVVRGPAVVMVALAIYGLTNGMITVLRTEAIATIFGAPAYGRISGALALVSTFGRAAGPFAAASGHDAAGGYAPVLAVFAILLGAAAAGARIADRELGQRSRAR